MIVLATFGVVALLDDSSSSDEADTAPANSDAPATTLAPADPLPPATTVPPEVCAQVRALVDESNADIATLTDETEIQSVSFYAAVLSEQRTITFVMNEQPTCFSLEERAAAAGLLDGVQALLDDSIANPPQAPLQTIPQADPESPDDP